MPIDCKTDDLRIANIREVTNPHALIEQLPITEQAAAIVIRTRQAINDILAARDDRLVVISGPCSIHDPDAALDYARRLSTVAERHGDDLLVIMRVYFEKPRTTVGWKGFINDPDLDESFNINKGLRLARQLLLDINNTGVPAGTEYLDIITPQYVSDLIGWGAIGARTTESQVHREVASGLSCPVGFKNGTDGNLQVAVDAVRAATHPHHFLSLTKDGHSAIFTTTGNPDTHIILRGGKTPNYTVEHVEQACRLLESAGLSQNVMIDLSHANSRKQASRQREVGADVMTQMSVGDTRIIGVMIESHLVEGRQDVVPGQATTYGQSITDACLGWDDSVELIAGLADAVRERRAALGRKKAS